MQIHKQNMNEKNKLTLSSKGQNTVHSLKLSKNQLLFRSHKQKKQIKEHSKEYEWDEIQENREKTEDDINQNYFEEQQQQFQILPNVATKMQSEDIIEDQISDSFVEEIEDFSDIDKFGKNNNNQQAKKQEFQIVRFMTFNPQKNKINNLSHQIKQLRLLYKEVKSQVASIPIQVTEIIKIIYQLMNKLTKMHKQQQSSKQRYKNESKNFHERLLEKQIEIQTIKTQKQRIQTKYKEMASKQSIDKEKSNKIEKLQMKVYQLCQQNECLNESIFDFEQKIAQIDLQVEKRVKKQLEKQRKQKQIIIQESNMGQEEKQSYVTRIAYLQKQIDELLKKSAFQQQQYFEKEVNLQRWEDQLKNQEQIFQENNRKYTIKIKGLEKQNEELRKKQSQLNFMAEQLAIKENQQHIMHENQQKFKHNKSTSDDVLETDVHRRKYHQEKSYRMYSRGQSEEKSYMKFYPHSSQTKNSGVYNRAALNKQYYSTTGNNFGGNVGATGTAHLQKYKTRLNVHKQQPSTYKDNSFQYNKSSNGIKKKSMQHNRLQNLGSKLQKLRQQIRKQIKDNS